MAFPQLEVTDAFGRRTRAAEGIQDAPAVTQSILQNVLARIKSKAVAFVYNLGESVSRYNAQNSS